MEKEQAIDLLDNLIGMIEDNQGNDYDTAFRMGIEALKAQLSQEGTTSDMISRQAAIDAINLICPIDTEYDCTLLDRVDVRCVLTDLPSAQPETHEGYWIPHEGIDGDIQYECSECGVLWEFNDGTPEDNEAYFCPKCGERMRGAQNG